MKTIDVNVFNLSSIDEAIKDIDKFSEKLKRLETELPEALCKYGVERATLYFQNAAYDILLDGTGISGFDIDVTYMPDQEGFNIIASGHEVAFIEFGAGVFYNGDGYSYLGTRPDGISGIGEYGKGHGQQKAWAFWDEFTGTWKKTHGTPAGNCLYFTVQDIIDIIADEARRILNDD